MPILKYTSFPIKVYKDGSTYLIKVESDVVSSGVTIFTNGSTVLEYEDGDLGDKHSDSNTKTIIAAAAAGLVIGGVGVYLINKSKQDVEGSS